MILVFALDYPKSAKHRPQPVVVATSLDVGPDIASFRSAPVGGQVRRKFTAFDLATTPPTLLRRDYALDDLRKLGAQLPELYCDELGNIRDCNDKLVMAGPQGTGQT